MADLELMKRWKSTRFYLAQARKMLPTPLRENTGKTPVSDLATLKAYDEWLDHNELELALDEIEGLGDLNECRGEFWRNLEKAASCMGLDDRAASLRQKFQEAFNWQSGRWDAD